MAWMCSGGSNAELVRNLVREGVVSRGGKVEAAMRAVDRCHYCRKHSHPYQDSPQPIGYDQTISAPHMHATCLEHVKDYLRPGARVLDCGSGSGYLMGCFAEMVGAEGRVRGIEYVAELVPWSIENLRKDGYGAMLDTGAMQVRAGDASKGWDDEKFDVIHVGAGAPHIPKPLVDALAAPGVMVVPVDNRHWHGGQTMKAVHKDRKGHVSVEDLMGVRYVPFHMPGTEVYCP